MVNDQDVMRMLRETWNRNPMIATLFARHIHAAIPADVIQKASGIQQSIQTQREITDITNAGLGAMGIFGGAGSGGGGFNFEEMLFYSTMGLIKQYNGDPPVSPSLTSRAEEIVAGQLDPMQAFALAGNYIPGYAQVLQMLGPFIGDMSPMFQQLGFIMAAMAVPREDIARILGLEDTAKNKEDVTRGEDSVNTNFDAAFNRSIQSAEEAITAGRFELAEENLFTALQMAEQTPTPGDDVVAIDHMCLLAFKSRVNPDNLKLCVRILENLNEQNSFPEQLSRIAVALSVLSESYGLGSEVDASLSAMGQSLLGKSIPRKQRLPLTLATAGCFLRMGNTAEAEDLVDGVREKYRAHNDRLDIATLEADIYWNNGDNDGAADILIDALDSAKKADSQKYLGTLQKLISVWPGDRDGIEPWLDEFQARVNRDVEEPQATLNLITVMLSLIRAGKIEEAKYLKGELNLELLEKTVPGPLQDMVRQIRESLEHVDRLAEGPEAPS